MFVRIRPPRPLSYEHMFPRSTPSPLTRRARNALSLARSFLLLEDDYDVDWEVDQDESGRGDARERQVVIASAGRGAAAGLHPHRRPLQGRSARERAGRPAPAPQVCLSPVPHASRRRIERSPESRAAALR